MIGFVWPFSSPSQSGFERAVLSSVSLPWLEAPAHLHVLKTHSSAQVTIFILLFQFCLPCEMTARGCPNPLAQMCFLQDLGQYLMSPNLYPVFISIHKSIFHTEMFVDYQHHIVVGAFFFSLHLVCRSPSLTRYPQSKSFATKTCGRNPFSLFCYEARVWVACWESWSYRVSLHKF